MLFFGLSHSFLFFGSPLDHSVFEHRLRASHCRWGLTARAARRKPPDSVHRRKLLNWSNEPLMYPSKTMKTLCWKLQIIPERSPTLDPGFWYFSSRTSLQPASPWGRTTGDEPSLLWKKKRFGSEIGSQDFVTAVGTQDLVDFNIFQLGSEISTEKESQG